MRHSLTATHWLAPCAAFTRLDVSEHGRKAGSGILERIGDDWQLPTVAKILFILSIALHCL
jgi:hypothetical protein